MNAIFRGFSERICISLFIVLGAVGRLSAQTSNGQTGSDTNSEQIAALQLQLTNAWHQVEAIVNQPVTAYRRDAGYDVSVYRPGWFHPGAMTPDFNRVDVRKSQQLVYTSPWVSSDLNPNMMFRGSDLEFNANTKLFYTNRDLPKKRLTEADMLQINSLYRIIGHCQSEIDRIQNPLEADSTTVDTQDDTNGAPPPKAIAVIERIPQQTRIFYGSIIIGALVVAVVGMRLIRKKSD
ncbi:MAG TPA: hypothetical protein VGY56_06060 [Verrucomicrobiae bacterium]|nr:hypothetical protein [Verrucomicrobiae bacterium]